MPAQDPDGEPDVPNEIDYSSYSLAELQQARRTIDAERHPDRAARLDTLIRERTAAAMRSSAAGSTVPNRSWSISSNDKKVVLIAIGAIVALGIAAAVAFGFAFSAFWNSDIRATADTMFGDQHLKTAVALIELHRVRYGEYPAELDELKFTGQWDKGAILSVEYCSSDDRTAYFISVSRGWVGKPDLDLDEEFWQGTGYESELGPCP